MKLLICLLVINSFAYAKDIMDIGNLDVKGNMDLPRYQMNSDILSLQSSLQKVAKLNYEEKNDEIDEMTSTSNFQRESLLSEDLNFDLKIKKVRLD